MAAPAEKAGTSPKRTAPLAASDADASDTFSLSGDGSPGERWLGLGVALLVALTVAAGAVPELVINCPDLNDSAYHVAIAQRMKEALARGESPIDFWYPDVALGFPLLRHYQFLPHLSLVAVDAVVGRLIPLATTYRIVFGVLLAVFPLAIYGSLRRLGLRPLAAGCSALIAPLLSTPYLYGLGFESYLWGGSGLYAQLFASVLAPLAFASAYRAVATGRGLGRAALLIAATFASQLVYGYMMALSTLAFIVPGPRRLHRAGRVALLAVATFLIGSCFIVPALQDAEFANHSVWEKQEKMDSLGAKAVLGHLSDGKLVLGHLLAGRLFDNGRVPVVTILAALGLLYAARRGATPLRRLGGLCIAWLLRYFGRPTWGRLIDLLPLARDAPLHRFIGGVHLFAIPLAGCGLAFVMQCIATPQRWLRMAAAGAVLGLLLAPAVNERAAYLLQSKKWKQDALVGVRADAELQPLLAELHALKGGRVYVGIPGREKEYLRVGGIPLTAFCLLDGIDTLGFLWIAITYAGDIQVWFNPDDPLHCRIFGVRYLVFEQNRAPPAFAQLRAEFGRYRVYEVPEASYFGVVDVPYGIRCTKRTVYNVGNAWLKSTLPVRREYPALLIGGRGPADVPVARFDDSDPNSVLVAPAGLSASAGTLTQEADSWSCAAELARPAAVVRRAGYHPGLRGTVDGVPATVFPVTPGFAAVQVPAGRHEIRFTYAPATRWPWYAAGVLAFVLAPPVMRLLRLDCRRPGSNRGPLDPQSSALSN